MRRVLLWIAGIVLALVIVLVLAFKFSPWPSVAIIQYAFSNGDTVSEEKLLKHVPPGISATLEVSYGAGSDERLDVFRQEGATGPQSTVVWVHGGGWIGGSKTGVSNYLKVLAGQGYTTIAVEYSTGFGSSYPTPVKQVNAALGYINAHAAELNVDPTKIVLAGDSAGSQLAAQVSIITTDPEYADMIGITPSLAPSQLAGVILASGAYDLEGIDLHGEMGWFLNTVLWAYSGIRDFMSDPQFRLLSVTQYVTAAFPPAFITSGNGDPLSVQARQFAAKLDELGVRNKTLFFPDDYSPALQHEYQFDLDIPAGAEAQTLMLEFLQETTTTR